ncbi:hypothetical protein [Bacillus atrophaeus]|uniref:hypothetical protein n=1 Tax=Bacillus atrophaeus TaxID=1452 RepID=UPI002DB5F5A0|nr:hypothetical protein [Bacillus atrophaeus]MEC2310640.1 hypothetical protein [Bacillus atrophaeus]
MGSILKTRFHVIDGEISWIHEILGEKVFHPDYVSLKASAIKQLSMDYQSDVVEVINSCGEEDGVYSGYSKLDG